MGREARRWVGRVGYETPKKNKIKIKLDQVRVLAVAKQRKYDLQ